MSTASVELKVFVPARDFALSQQFYKDLGFLSPWNSDELAYLHHGERCAFLLQNYYVKEFTENLMLHLLVEDADAGCAKVRDSNLSLKGEGQGEGRYHPQG